MGRKIATNSITPTQHSIITAKNRMKEFSQPIPSTMVKFLKGHQRIVVGRELKRQMQKIQFKYSLSKQRTN